MNILHSVPLAPYTTYKIGGPAEHFVEVTSAEELAEAVTYARAEGIPFFVLGLGANVLITDAGIKGLVILNRAQNVSIEDGLVTAESGVTVAELIRLTTEAGLSGLEHYAGIPSTVGGALWQNLHFLSPDRQRTMYIAEVITGGRVLDGDGKIIDVDTDFYRFGYDESVFRDNHELICLDARFTLQPEKREVLEERIKANLEWRAARQPDVVEFPSCGSVFKKIEGVGAGRLIEQAGLKGKRIGGAEVSTLHANFIVNRGGATAADILSLIDHIQAEVERVTGYRLEPEIRVIGEK